MELAPTILQLGRFETNKLSYIKKLMDWGLLPREGEYKCPKCGEPLKLFVSSRSIDGYEWNCSRKVVIKKKRRICKVQISIRSGTFFERSQLTFTQILGFVIYWMDSVKMKVIKYQLSLSYKSAVNWASFCREVVLYALTETQEPIGGEGKIVEIDESKFSRRKFKDNDITQETWVFGGIERGSGRVFMLPVRDRSEETLINMINKWILPGTKIMLPCSKSNSLGSLESEGLVHEDVNHSFELVAPKNANSQNIRSAWHAVKVAISPSNRKADSIAGNLARYMLIKKAKAEGLDPVLLFFKMAGQLYSPLVEREIEIRRPGAALEEAEDEAEEEEEEY